MAACVKVSTLVRYSRSRERKKDGSSTTEENCVSSTGPRGERRDVNGLAERVNRRVGVWTQRDTRDVIRRLR